MARYLAKAFNSQSFNYKAFAYHFVQHAPGAVIKNAFRAFDAILDVLAERYDNDANLDSDEYDCAVVAKRIQDSLQQYK